LSSSLINVFLGVIAGIVSWLLLTKLLRPRLQLHNSIERVRRDGEPDIYRVRYNNPRLRRVEDVHVTIRLFRQRPTGTSRRAWLAIEIPLDEPFRPVLGRESLPKRTIRVLRRRRRLTQRPRLCLEEVRGDSQFFVNLPAACPSIMDLQEFMVATRGTIEMSIRASDGFSGTYRTLCKTYGEDEFCVIDWQTSQAESVPPGEIKFGSGEPLTGPGFRASSRSETD